MAEIPRCKVHLIQALEYNAASWQKTHGNDKWREPGSRSSQQHWLEKQGLPPNLIVPQVFAAPR